jgi:hypothetical protein
MDIIFSTIHCLGLLSTQLFTICILSVARHNGSYKGGPFDFSNLLISVRTVPSGKINDFLKASRLRPLPIEEQPEDEDERAAFPESQPNSL